MTSPPAAPGMPSAEAIEDEIRPMSYEGADLTECVGRIIALFRPAFEAQHAKLAQAVEDEREHLIAEYTRQIDVALKEYDENLGHGDDAMGPDYFIDRGMERAEKATRARSASAAARGETR